MAGRAIDNNNKNHYCDTISIILNQLPEPDLGNDVFLCQGEQVTLSPGSFNEYIWNTGTTGNTLNVNSTNSYTVTVTDGNSCQNSDTVYVFVQSPFEGEQICFLTADMELNNNVVVWEKTPGMGTDYYKIYRENTQGGYEVIGTHNFIDAGIFVDTLSFSDQLKYNYKLSLVDTCGNESELSPEHGTIFLKVNKGSGGFDLTWTAYEGTEVAKYEVYRGNDSTNMALVKDIAGGITSWSDNFVPQCVVYYKVKAVVASTCINAGNPDYTGIESNIAGNGAVEPLPIIMGPVSFCDGEQTTLDAGNYTSYLWSNGKTTQTIDITVGGTYTVNVSNEFGCYGTSEPFILQVSSSPQFDLGTDTSVCGAQVLSLTGPSDLKSYLWDNGSTQQDRSVSSTGLYKLTVTDDKGCKGEDEILVTYNNLPTINLNTIEYICGGEPAYLDPGEFVSYLWSNGSSDRIQKISTPQTLDITVTDVHNCISTKQVLIETRSSGIVILGPDISLCEGDSFELTPQETYVSYLWSDGTTNDILKVSDPGNYALQAVDIFNCSSSDTVKVDIIPIPPSPDLGPERNICYGESLVLDADVGYTSYLWNNNDNTQTITVDTTGIYSVKVYAENGCYNTASVKINTAIPYTSQEICMVTVTQGKNIIVWENPELSSIEQYLIYRESTIADTYELIGVQSVSQLTVFIDPLSAPIEKSDRYKISVIDTCGNESPLSREHKTMHLTINQGLNGEVNLIWENYEGMIFGTYELYRGKSADNLELIKTIQSSITSYTDVNAPDGTLFYQVAIVKPDACIPSEYTFKKAGSDPFLKSLSNFADNTELGLGINDILNDINLTVYPNPFTDFTTINYTLEKSAKVRVEIFNLVGEKLFEIFNNNQSKGTYKLEMNASDVNDIPGLYYLKISVDDRIIMKKAIHTR